MKVRQRLALQFMLTSGLVTLSIFVFIYFVTRGLVHGDFIDRLNQQTNLEILHYAAPNVKHIMPPGSFNLIEPNITIYSDKREVLYSRGDYDIAPGWINLVARNDRFNIEIDQYTIVGRKYEMNERTYYVFISDQDIHGQRELNQLLKVIGIGWLFGLLLFYYAGLFFSKRALQPVRHVTHEVNHITENTLGHRLTISKDEAKWDEIDELTITFNGLLDRIENAFAAQRRFVQNASHELKTPLTAMIAEIELALQRTRTQEEYQEVLKAVLEGSERLAKTTQGLLALTRFEELTTGEGEMDAIDMVELVRETVSNFKKQYRREIYEEYACEGIMVMGHPLLLQTAIRNLLDNANKYSSGRVEIHIRQLANSLIISIIDDGIGIPADEVEKVRVPLFRARNVGSVPGAGLGLALVERILRAHGGTLEINSEERKGTKCTLVLGVRDQWI